MCLDALNALGKVELFHGFSPAASDPLSENDSRTTHAEAQVDAAPAPTRQLSPSFRISLEPPVFVAITAKPAAIASSRPILKGKLQAHVDAVVTEQFRHLGPRYLTAQVKARGGSNF